MSKVNLQLIGWPMNQPSEEIHICAKQMRNGKAAGTDGFLAEFYKYGGSQLQEQIPGYSQNHVEQGNRSAIPGQEATGWPESWSQGIVIPLFKSKGSRNDKNQYRGITLLSVGSKLLARVVAQRVQKLSEAWLAENQSGSEKIEAWMSYRRPEGLWKKLRPRMLTLRYC